MCTHQDGEPRRIPRPCAPTPAAIPIAPLQSATRTTFSGVRAEIQLVLSPEVLQDEGFRETVTGRSRVIPQTPVARSRPPFDLGQGYDQERVDSPEQQLSHWK